ncbi:glycine cleavage system aminomethyltransferase GcvT [Arthrobacter roseus]|uniref:glycine cleavage system aminomethyltransferase GcvT n=1 Tax=Arthrobacter roseus TaxID=136274 RepID=UPI0019631E06|nr:glycine cleavage system aminomethyltransferase GcvT [Arthrobacter roseus]MBM7848367.1 aminomethyltransferase [Arthrobacter roseus]
MTDTNSASPEAVESVLLEGPLHAWHVEAGARMAEFGGWLMPLHYEGGGVVAEHSAVRSSVGLFDVSHLGKILVKGPGALDFVNGTLANDLRKIGVGQAQYTMALNETGGVIDDLIAYIRSEEEIFLIPNAANSGKVAAKLVAAREESGAGIQITDQHRDFAVFALQGPKSAEVLGNLGLELPTDYMAFIDVSWKGMPLSVCRTGYTGEHGYELVPRWEDALTLWETISAASTAYAGRAAGLAARDTLRTEMGYALHGHELTPDISPVEARVGWAIGWKKDAFWGRDAVTRIKAEGAQRKAVGLLALERGVPRADVNVLGADGGVVGRTTSGTFSPTLQNGIALALVDPSVQLDDELAVEIRGRKLAVRVVRPPFIETGVRG